MKSKIDRSNHRRSSPKKSVLKNFANFTRKHLCFPVKFAKVLGTPIIKNICERLLLHRGCGCDHGDIILNRSNNSEISIDTSGLQQAGDILIKQYFGISNIAVCRQKRFPIGSLANNQCPIMFHYAKICVSYWLSHNN